MRVVSEGGHSSVLVWDGSDPADSVASSPSGVTPAINIRSYWRKGGCFGGHRKSGWYLAM